MIMMDGKDYRQFIAESCDKDAELNSTALSGSRALRTDEFSKKWTRDCEVDAIRINLRR